MAHRTKHTPAKSKVATVMREEMHKFKHKTLHSGSKKGPIVKNRQQAIAIGLNVARKKARRGK